MDFERNDDQQMMKALVERFVGDRYQPGQRAAYQAADRGYSLDNWRLLAEQGILALPFAAEAGGIGGDSVDIITVMEALGAGLAIEPLLAEILIGGRLLETAGTPAQRDAWLPAIIAGDRHLGLAFAEHGSRWGFSEIAATVSDGRLTGAKSFVPAGLDGLIVTARAGGRAGLFLVEAADAGIGHRDYRLIDGSAAWEVTFDGVAAEPLAGGIEALEAVADEARLAACAEMVGIMGTLFETTLAYVRQRRQFGAAIGSFQAVQHRLADRYADLEQARSQLYRAALAGAAGRAAAIAGAKAFISAAGIRIGEECIQLHGGMGVSDELELGQGYKRLLLLGSLFGDADREIVRYNTALRAA